MSFRNPIHFHSARRCSCRHCYCYYYPFSGCVLFAPGGIHYLILHTLGNEKNKPYKLVDNEGTRKIYIHEYHR